MELNSNKKLIKNRTYFILIIIISSMNTIFENVNFSFIKPNIPNMHTSPSTLQLNSVITKLKESEYKIGDSALIKRTGRGNNIITTFVYKKTDTEYTIVDYIGYYECTIGN